MDLDLKQEDIIRQVHEYVKAECKGFSEIDDIFENHILNVERFAEKLADTYKANKFVVMIAAYLHDITYVQTGDHSTHEIEGSVFVKEYLKRFNLKNEEIELISKCILHHRGSKHSERKTMEEKIIACADAMDHIDRCLHMFFLRIDKQNYQDSIKFMQGKLQRGWNKIELPKARDMVKAKYDAARVLFGF